MTSTPTITAVGAPNAGTTAATTYTNPTHEPGHVLFLAVECGQTTGVPTPPANWFHVPNSPRAQGSNVEAVSLMWHRCTTTSETNPQVAAQANHQCGFVFGVSGAVLSGNPYESGGQGVNSNLSTAFTVVPSATTIDNELVVLVAGAATGGADQFGAFTDASVSSITKQQSTNTALGNGGNLDLVTAVKAAHGSLGTFAATLTSQQWVGIVIAIPPIPDDVGWGVLL